MSARSLLAEHRDAVDPVSATAVVTRCHVCGCAVGVRRGRLEVHDRPVTLGGRTTRALCDGTAEVARG